MRVTKFLAVALATSIALMSAGPAAASAPRADVQDFPAGLQWEPYRTQPFTSPAGQTCSFPLAGEPVLDEERIATISTFDDGRPQRQIIMGDLRMRYTNLDTGASVEYDLNGIGFIEYGSDGSYTFRLIGGAAVGFRPTDPYAAGMWLLDGHHEIYTAPQRAYREMTVDHGSEHNICIDLD